MEKKRILSQLIDNINDCEQILSARVYGSWFYDEKTADIDIAVMIPSNNGLVDSEVYKILYQLRKRLSDLTHCDIDLVPHTIDEVTNINSPLSHPRYNPSLVLGENIKGNFMIQPIYEMCDKMKSIDFIGITSNILLDNRTICRRQLVRSLTLNEARIFVSKLLHGPGNALTYYSLRHGLKYICSPSDMLSCLKNFDLLYNVDSTPAMQFFKKCKEKISFEDALRLMFWYENLVALTLYGNAYSESYQKACFNLESKAQK